MMGIGEGNMSLISEKTIEDFAIWAKENEDKSIFPGVIKEKSSYYKNRDTNEDYMMEYSFQTIAVLIDILKEYSGLKTSSEVLQKLVLAICQERCVHEAEEEKCKSEEKKHKLWDNISESNIKEPKVIINIKLLETISKWIGENGNRNIFSEINREAASYYIDRVSEETYIMEYVISNMEQLKNALDSYIELPPGLSFPNELIVEMCKKRCTNELKKDGNENCCKQKETTDEGKKILPEHIYVF